jgi:hypothetical protein
MLALTAKLVPGFTKSSFSSAFIGGPFSPSMATGTLGHPWPAHSPEYH